MRGELENWVRAYGDSENFCSVALATGDDNPGILKDFGLIIVSIGWLAKQAEGDPELKRLLVLEELC